MNKKLILLLNFLLLCSPNLLALQGCEITACELTSGDFSLSDAKQAIKDYYYSGKYHKEIDYIINQAYKYLDEQLLAKVDNPAIVLDIDETAISNWPNIENSPFWGDESENALEKLLCHIHKCHQGKNAIAIESVLAFYNYAKQKKVAVFFLTGRTPDLLNVTLENLKKVGYANWDGLYVRPFSMEGRSEFKPAIRKSLIEIGYNIIINIGDQDSDLAGGYALKTFKLPNPFYFF